MVHPPFRGFLCINKPSDITSRDAVNVVQRLMRPAKVGHAGTLDPLATGVLVIAIGKATRLISCVQDMPKCYSARFELGSTSDTEDNTGIVVKQHVQEIPTEEHVARVCGEFIGTIQQKPPAFSALKVKGKRAYQLAREGKEVRLTPRPVSIFQIELKAYDYPVLELDIECGSGTYIRSLGRDIGERLGCGAIMSALTRTGVGNFQLTSSCDLDQLDSVEAVKDNLMPMVKGVTLESIQIDSSQKATISFGREIELATTQDELAAIDDEGELVAIVRRSSNSSRFRPAINFSAKG